MDRGSVAARCPAQATALAQLVAAQPSRRRDVGGLWGGGHLPASPSPGGRAPVGHVQPGLDEEPTGLVRVGLSVSLSFRLWAGRVSCCCFPTK